MGGLSLGHTRGREGGTDKPGTFGVHTELGWGPCVKPVLVLYRTWYLALRTWYWVLLTTVDRDGLGNNILTVIL